jgi:hypothetical protein
MRVRRIPAEKGLNYFSMLPGRRVGYEPEAREGLNAEPQILKLTTVLFPNYFWKVGSNSQDDLTPDISQGSLLYAFNYMLPDAWQMGMNPTITYNDKADANNQWNVPAGLEYTVVSQETFGKRAAFRFQITPVIPSLISKPIFGK